MKAMEVSHRMESEVTTNDPLRGIRGTEVVRVYACRIARRMLLSRNCEADHPVLLIEQDLIQMAQSKLQEFLLASFVDGDQEKVKTRVSDSIRKIAAAKIRSSEEDQDVKDALVHELYLMDSNDLLPPIH